MSLIQIILCTSSRRQFSSRMIGMKTPYLGKIRTPFLSDHYQLNLNRLHGTDYFDVYSKTSISYGNAAQSSKLSFNKELSTIQAPILDPTGFPKDYLCTEDEIYDLITNLDSTKSSGPDGIAVKMLKATAASIAPNLTTLFKL